MSTSLRALLSGYGALPAATVRARLGVSPATLSRLVAAEGRDVLRLGKGRATRYALARALPGLPPRVPVYRIDERAEVSKAGELVPLVGGATWVESSSGQAHLHEGLPPFVVDLAPAGYLGRRFHARFPELGLPRHLNDWGDEHRFVAVARRGEDQPGDLVVGDESLDRWLSTSLPEVAVSDYPALAEASAEGGAGSSAAGEHPKFAAFREGHQRLVKFTPGDGSPSDLRWRDLLTCESLALAVLSDHGVLAAASQVVDVGTRRFLDVVRFDRVGARGRRGVLTLAPLDDDLFGGRDSWTAAASRLEHARLLSAADARRVRLLEAFGIWIGNIDRHFGNLAFFADGLIARPRLELTPAYDMVPMLLAPVAGVVPHRPVPRPTPTASLLDVWDEAQTLAAHFWRRVASETSLGWASPL